MKQRVSKQVEAITAEHEKVTKGRKSKYQQVFYCEYGNDVLDDLISFTGFNQIAYRPGCDANDIIFLEGQRAVVKYILDQLEYKIKYDKKSDPSA